MYDLPTCRLVGLCTTTVMSVWLYRAYVRMFGNSAVGTFISFFLLSFSLSPLLEPAGRVALGLTKNRASSPLSDDRVRPSRPSRPAAPWISAGSCRPPEVFQVPGLGAERPGFGGRFVREKPRSRGASLGWRVKSLSRDNE
jgi:hypothetical protein